VLATGVRLDVADFSGDERVAQVAREHMNLGPSIVVPLGGPSHVRGVLTAGRRRGARPLSPAAVDMLASFADQAAIALELAEHRARAERLAVFEDRDRIARDLHDLVIQRLYATGMSLQGTVPLVAAPEVADRINRSVDALDETIREIRTAIFALQTRPEPGQVSLRARVLGIADEITGPLGFAPSLQLDGNLDEAVPEDAAEHMLSALREALSNVARHAGASRVDVTVRAAADLVLTVRDDGSGISDTGRRSGLSNLEQRAAKLGGSLSVQRAMHGGTELSWRVPLRAAS
jgi:signal transduction histidine kinase